MQLTAKPCWCGSTSVSPTTGTTSPCTRSWSRPPAAKGWPEPRCYAASRGSGPPPASTPAASCRCPKTCRWCGALGAAARYLLDRTIATRQTSPFPLGTLAINITGSSALGLLFGLAAAHQVPSSVVTLAGTGFLGAYTTFSTFTFETVRLLEDGAWRYAAWNLLLSGPFSFAGATAGFVLTR
jgi:fluoride exporter